MATDTQNELVDWGQNHFDHHAGVITNENAWELYDHLREESPVTWSDAHGGFWLVSRYDDCVRIFKDPATFMNSHGAHLPHNESTPRWIPLVWDPPEHTEYRRFIMNALSPSAIKELAPLIHELTVDYVGRFIAEGGGDFAAAVAMPLPVSIFSRWMGLTDSFTERVHEITENFWALAADETQGGPVQMMFDLLDEELDRREAEPKDDLLTELLNARVGDRKIRRDEILNAGTSFLFAGQDNTLHAMCTFLVQVAEDQNLQQELRDDPSLIPSVLEESMRYHAPVHVLMRTCTKDVTVGETEMKAGDRLLMLLPAANRDPERYPDGDQFCPHRKPRQQLAFGMGIHHCAGIHLAKREMHDPIEYLIANSRFELDGEPDVPGLIGAHMMGVRYLPLKCTPIAAPTAVTADVG
jgi:cytochrome P450